MTMAASRGQTAQVNLKERIAALQQRNVSPNTHQSAQAVPRGLPSPGAGGLRDRIAKFEEKGGLPVPRASFAMGAPQLAENAPPKKRGELYGNRVPGLGRPSGAPVSRSGSPQPSTDEPGPRKRCISTGTPLSSTPFNFSTDVPVPALPNGLPSFAPRRNSLAVNFGPGRRVMSTNDAEYRTTDFVDVSSSSPVSDSSPETAEEQSPSPEVVSPVVQPDDGATLPVVEEAQMSRLEVPEDTRQNSEPPPVSEQPLPADSSTSEVDTPGEDLPAPEIHPFPLSDASQNVSQSSTSEQSNKDEVSDYQSAPQSAVSQPSPSLPESASPILSSTPANIATSPEPTPVPAETVAISPPPSPPENVTKPVTASQDTITVSVSNPTVPVSPDVRTLPLQSKSKFRAVVHRKVAEPTIITAPPSSLAPPAISQLSQQRRTVSGNAVEMPPSPGGGGDLAILLEDAALLEMRLTEGDSMALKSLPNIPTPTSATFQTDTRHASASTLTEHAHMPSTDSGSQSARSMSIPSIREPLIDGEIPEEEETDGRSLASTTFSQRSPSHRKYLSNIYRLTGRRSSSYMPGTYPRDSMSMSSEDSSPVTTPSDNGKRKGFGIAWPSASPKRGGPNVGRSSSFADKIFNRNRTKSNVSTADQASERNSLYESSQPSLSISFSTEVSPEGHSNGVDRPASWISPVDSNSEFSPASSLLDKDIFDAFPSVPQTLPPGFHLDAENAGRNQVNPRLSVV